MFRCGSKPVHPAEHSLRPLDSRQPTYPPGRKGEFTVLIRYSTPLLHI